MDTLSLLGKIITGPAVRDAVHVAVAPVTARHRILPGQRVKVENGLASLTTTPGHGIADPFLREPVEAGQKFFVWLYPGTVTSLVHHWTHPAFDPALPINEEAYDR